MVASPPSGADPVAVDKGAEDVDDVLVACRASRRSRSDSSPETCVAESSDRSSWTSCALASTAANSSVTNAVKISRRIVLLVC